MLRGSQAWQHLTRPGWWHSRVACAHSDKESFQGTVNGNRCCAVCHSGSSSEAVSHDSPAICLAQSPPKPRISAQWAVQCGSPCSTANRLDCALPRDLRLADLSADGVSSSDFGSPRQSVSGSRKLTLGVCGKGLVGIGLPLYLRIRVPDCGSGLALKMLPAERQRYIRCHALRRGLRLNAAQLAWPTIRSQDTS